MPAIPRSGAPSAAIARRKTARERSSAACRAATRLTRMSTRRSTYSGPGWPCGKLRLPGKPLRRWSHLSLPCGMIRHSIPSLNRSRTCHPASSSSSYVPAPAPRTPVDARHEVAEVHSQQQRGMRRGRPRRDCYRRAGHHGQGRTRARVPRRDMGRVHDGCEGFVTGIGANMGNSTGGGRAPSGLARFFGVSPVLDRPAGC